jgi:hypothetical protein
MIPSTISDGFRECRIAFQIGSGLTDGFALELYSEELKAYLLSGSVEILEKICQRLAYQKPNENRTISTQVNVAGMP